MKFASLFFALGALCAQTLGAVINVNGKEYSVFVPEWEVELTPGGEKVILNGTVEEVHQELLSRNPNWNADFSFNATKLEARDSELAKRTDWSNSHYFCGGRWPYCDSQVIGQGISYLYGVPGRPSNGAGPGNCGRVSCSYDSAIWWCNDDTKTKTLESFGSIASGAQYLRNRCERPAILNHFEVAGQIFHPTNWNVIIRKDSC